MILEYTNQQPFPPAPSPTTLTASALPLMTAFAVFLLGWIHSAQTYAAS